MKDDFYNQLTTNEKQICDLCRDWNLNECEECSLFLAILNKKQGGKQYEHCVIHN